MFVQDDEITSSVTEAERVTVPKPFPCAALREPLGFGYF